MKGFVSLKRKLHRTFSTIRTRILLSTISLIVFISTIIAVISYFLVSNNLQQNLIQTSEIRLTFLCTSIDASINEIKDFVRSCQISSKITSFALETDTTDNRIKREAHDFIMETYSTNTALRSHLIRLVIVGNERKDIVQVAQTSYSSHAVSADAINSLPCFTLLHSHPDTFSAGILTDPFFTTKSVSMIPFISPIVHPYKADEIGYIFTEISLSVITGPMQNYLPEADSRLFFQIGDSLYQYQDGSMVFSENNFTVIEDLSHISLNSDTDIKKVRDKNSHETFILIRKPLGSESCYIMECVNESLLSENIFHTFFIIVLIIIIAASAIGLILFWFLSRTVNAPVKQLKTRIKRIEEGDFSRDPSTEWEHELGDIGKTINDLSENVLLLMNQRIEDERQKKDYEYRMLQSQINPHFLYNTLNSIKWMATIQNSPGIAEMTTSLSRLLKDISKGTTSLITIEHELSLIDDYFTIQQYRYGGTITLTHTVDEEELFSSQILKFTLQPIVENAIFHGIEPKGTAGDITIHIYRDAANDIHIDVTDNGVGMDPQVVDNLLDAESSASSSFFKEIGISNVHKRLKYEFGNQYGLSITSQKGKFTTVSILLPFRKNC